MHALPGDLRLALPDELVADAVHHRHDDLVEEVVSLDIEISRLRRHAELPQALLDLPIALRGAGVMAAQLLAPFVHFVAHLGDDTARLTHGEVARLDDTQEVGHRELSVLSRAVIPDVPHKERIDRARERLEILLHVEDDMVVECHRHTDVVERGRITLHVLDGVGVGMEDVWTAEDLARGLRGSLDEVVVVGIDTGDEPLSRLAMEGTHERGFLAALEGVLPRGEHDLEIEPVRLKLAEDGAPEEDVVVALYISHDLLPLLLRVQAVGCLEVRGREVILEPFHSYIFLYEV